MAAVLFIIGLAFGLVVGLYYGWLFGFGSRPGAGTPEGGAR